MSSNIKILDSAFGKGSYTSDGKNYQVACPECNSADKRKKKLHIKVDDLRYHCWICGLKGKNVLYLVKKIRPDIDVGKIKVQKNNLETDVPAQEFVKLPENLVPVYRKSKDPDVNAVKRYLLSRGFSMSDIFRWRVQTSTSGPYRRYALFPSFDAEGRVNYFLSRAIDEGKIRYKNAKSKKSQIIFNEIDIDWKKPVYLVEGVFDAVKCPENTIPMLGSEIAKPGALYEKLVRNQCKVIISLDADAQSKAYKASKMLSSSGCEVYITSSTNEKDLGDMSRSEALNFLKKASRFDSYNMIRHRISDLRSGSIF